MELLLIAFLKFPIAMLANWRLSSLLVHEEGPWSIFRRIRAFIAQKALVDEKSATWATFSEGIHCVWCVSLWFSPFVAVWAAWDVPSWVILTFALSGGSILVETVLDYLSKNGAE
jgi:hypothetical protein